MTKFDGAMSFRDCEAKGDSLLLVCLFLVFFLHQATHIGFKGHGPLTFNLLKMDSVHHVIMDNRLLFLFLFF